MISHVTSLTLHKSLVAPDFYEPQFVIMQDTIAKMRNQFTVPHSSNAKTP